MTRARVVTYGFSERSMVRAHSETLGEIGSKVKIDYPPGTVEFRMPLLGRFNVLNILAAFSSAWVLGLDMDRVVKSIEDFCGVPGRMEFVKAGEGVRAVVDYAHTEDALKNVLETLRPLTRGRLICVFGCGGNRDTTKRARMGEVSGRVSDHVILTSDNPRREDPEAILNDIEEGIKKTGVSYERIVDRRSAIRRSLSLAEKGDLVLVAGKGHEKFQEIGMSRLPFDDVAVIKEAASLGEASHRKAVCI